MHAGCPGMHADCPAMHAGCSGMHAGCPGMHAACPSMLCMQVVLLKLHHGLELQSSHTCLCLYQCLQHSLMEEGPAEDRRCHINVGAKAQNHNRQDLHVDHVV